MVAGRRTFALRQRSKRYDWAMGGADCRRKAAGCAGPAQTQRRLGVDSGINSFRRLVRRKRYEHRGLYVAPVDLDTGKLTGPPVLQSFWSERPEWSPDGRYLVHAYTGSSRGRTLVIRSTESGQVRELRPALQYFWNTSWMPDGQSLIAGGRDFKGRLGIYRIDAETGRASLISDNSTTGVEVSPDGKKIYYGIGFYIPEDYPARFVERDLVSGEIREVCQGQCNGMLSPNGRFLASIRADNQTKTSRMLLRPVAGGSVREIFLPQGLGVVRAWTPDGQAVLVSARERGESQLWLVPVSGDPARKLGIDTDGWADRDIRLHPNGRQIAFFMGRAAQEAWVLEDLLNIR